MKEFENKTIYFTYMFKYTTLPAKIFLQNSSENSADVFDLLY